MSSLRLKPTITINIFGVDIETTKEKVDEYNLWLEQIDKQIDEEIERRYSDGDYSSPIGTIGGNLTLSITQTSIGRVYIVKDSYTKTKFDLTNYDNW